MAKTSPKNLKVPNLRFPGFDGEWQSQKLGQLLEFKNGINASKEQYGKGVKFINVLDILNNDFITYDKIIGKVNVNSAIVDKYPVNYGDILFQRSSETREEVGTASVYLDKEKTATFGGFVIRGRKIGNYQPIFLNKVLKTKTARESITSRSGGSTRYNIGQDALTSIALHFPSLPEQEKIAAFLTLIDERISTQNKIIEELEILMRGLRAMLLTQKTRFKDKNGGDFPKWQQYELGDLLYYEQPTRYLVNSMEYDNSYAIPVLTAGKTFILGYSNETNGIFSENLPVIIFDDFTTAIKFVDFPFKVKSSAMKILLPKQGVNIAYVFEAMKLIDYTIGGHERHWISKYSKNKIPVPCREEQKQIVAFLSTISNKIEIEKQIFKNYLHQKQHLLASLFI